MAVSSDRSEHSIGLLLGLIGIAALLVRGLTALSVHEPGVMDASYHLHVAQNLAAGRGMVDSAVWNHLASIPAELPRASHLYWMPLPAWLAALGVAGLGETLGAFRAAQLPFIILGALVPPLTAWISWRLWHRRSWARLAGLLAMMTPSYLVYWVIPDSVTPYALALPASFAAVWWARRRPVGWLLVGVLLGLGHLARADAPLAIVALSWAAWRARDGRLSRFAAATSLVVVGFAVVMTPWWLRNVDVAGTPWAGGGLSTIWLRRYDGIFAFGESPSASSFFADGWAGPVASRIGGALANTIDLMRMFQFLLIPIAAVGMKRLRDEGRAELVEPVAVHAALFWFVMSFMFTEPARFGSLFRSAAGLLPWVVAVVPGGLDALAERYAQLRRRNDGWARSFFARSLLGMMVLLSAGFHVAQLAGVDATGPWNARLAHYAVIDTWLDARSATGPVLVVDPPGFAVTTDRPAVVVPSNGPASIHAAADHYGASWVVVESNIPSLRDVWRGSAHLDGFAERASLHDAAGSPVRLLERVR